MSTPLPGPEEAALTKVTVQAPALLGCPRMESNSSRTNGFQWGQCPEATPVFH